MLRKIKNMSLLEIVGIAKFRKLNLEMKVRPSGIFTVKQDLILCRWVLALASQAKREENGV
jgi:endonuclease III-like uncharacterized protein